MGLPYLAEGTVVLVVFGGCALPLPYVVPVDYDEVDSWLRVPRRQRGNPVPGLSSLDP